MARWVLLYSRNVLLVVSEALEFYTVGVPVVSENEPLQLCVYYYDVTLFGCGLWRVTCGADEPGITADEQGQ